MRDNGIATADINAVFKLYKKIYRIEITRIAPIIMSNFKPAIDASIKLAGLNRSEIVLRHLY